MNCETFFSWLNLFDMGANTVSIDARFQVNYPDTAKSSIKEDYFLMMRIFKMGKLFGLTPSTSNKNEKACLPQVIGIALVMSLLVLSYFSLVRNMDVIMSNHTTIAGVMLVLLAAEIIFVIYSIIFLTFCRENSWRQLFNRIQKLQNRIDRIKLRSSESRQYSFYLRIMLVISVMVPLMVARYHFLLKHGSYVKILLNSTNEITGLYIMFIITMYIAFTNWLKNRIEDINTNLNMLIHFQDDDTIVASAVDLCNVVHSIMEKFNSIFGRIVFYEICVVVLNLLYTFSYAVDDNDTEHEQKILNFLKPISYAVPITVMIMSCDSVEESGKKVISNAYLLHEAIQNSRIKADLLLLAECEEHWRPIFSAAGFFEVNQSCIASIFSALITYIVIIIQFNMVLQDDDTSMDGNGTVVTTTPSK